MHENHEGSPKAVRIRCDEETRRIEERASQLTITKDFAGRHLTEREWRRARRDLMVQIREAWTDGCLCKLCSYLESMEAGWLTPQHYLNLMDIYISEVGADHRDGFYPTGYDAVRAFRLRKSACASSATRREQDPTTQSQIPLPLLTG